MGTRRTVSLLLCISFALAAATGILFVPVIRLVIGLNNESMWRMIHFYSSDALAVLICFHIILNRKALMNYLRVARIRSILSYAIAALIFVGVICFGLYGSDLGIAAPWHEEELRRACLQEPTLISFPEDFEDGKADGWTLGPGWEVIHEDGNYVLSGSNEQWSSAYPKGSGWFNYTFTTRVKLTSGEFNIGFRRSETPFRSRYLLYMNGEGFGLTREINEEYLNLTGEQLILEPYKWYEVKIVSDGANIKFYLDDELKLDYTDSDFPIIFGSFAFDVGPGSHVRFDDIDVEASEFTQMVVSLTK
ncbi:MAG TPA: DUF4405 domain-containing protein [Dehalococcoidia bacterium]|nr:DUF4405 domain-containing protein [Dehalococcoidia bacterium]